MSAFSLSNHSLRTQTNSCQQFKKVMQKIVSREKEIKKIKNLIHSKEQSCFVTGLTATGKTFVLKNIFNQEKEACKLANPPPSGSDLETSTGSDLDFVLIDCVECLTLKILFERALRAWSESGISPPCPLIDEFIYQCQKLPRTKRRFLILDHCEELMELDKSIIPMLCKLGELTDRDFCVIFVSSYQWDDLLARAPAVTPPQIHFPSYTMAEAIDILVLDRPKGISKDFYAVYAKLVYSSFQMSCNNLSEIRYMAAMLYPKYVEPIKKGLVKKEESAKLYTMISGTLKKHLHSLYLRDVSGIEWESHLENHGMLTTASRRIEMPFLTKFLLIASFLASYNPSKYDSRFFTRGGEGRGKISKKAGSNNGSLVRTQLTGPKAFAIDRMLAIFYSIVEDDCKMTTDIHSQIATCISLRLLIRVSAPNNLNSMKCKCNISFALVKSIATSVRFDISKYLYDFVDV